MIILVLSHNRSHFQHYARDFYHDDTVRFLNPQTPEQLAGLRPNAIIELPEWYLGKCNEFMDRVSLIKVSLKMKRPVV